jgi:hypothetical protein
MRCMEGSPVMITPFRRRLLRHAAVGTLVFAVARSAPAASPAMRFAFGGTEWMHRWSKAGQNEFTPQGQEDLATWRDMVTLNMVETVRSGEQLAELANRVLGTYRANGRILRTDSKPRTPQREAEHLVAAAFVTPKFGEAAFARIVLVNGTGYVVVRSHRIHGEQSGGPLSEWLRANGQAIERELMAWEAIPAPAALKRLPQAS